MKRRVLSCLLVAALAGAGMAAPLAARTGAPVAKRGDVIVNVGAVTTVKTVVKRPKPTTVYIPVTVQGEETSSAVTSTVEEEVTTVITQTAVETQIVKETIQEGKTIPVTMTTTAFQLELQTQTQVIQVVETEYQQSTTVQTVQGVPVTQVVTVMMTDADNNEQPKPKETKTKEVPVSDEDEEEAPKPTQKGGLTAAPSATAASLLPSSVTTTATETKGGTLNLNNTANADADSGASVDSSNTNTNNVTVSIESAGDWAADNKWILIGVSVAIVVIAVAIGVFACSGSKGSHSSTPAQQSVVLATPAGAGPTQQMSVAPRPVQSLGRPSRCGNARGRYNRIGGGVDEDSSALSASSEDEYTAPVAKNRSGSMRSSRSGGGEMAEASLGRARSGSRSRRG